MTSYDLRTVVKSLDAINSTLTRLNKNIEKLCDVEEAKLKRQVARDIYGLNDKQTDSDGLQS
jgi:hypothetical protein